jgi:DNA-binding transcriptional ArsR family regulator
VTDFFPFELFLGVRAFYRKFPNAILEMIPLNHPEISNGERSSTFSDNKIRSQTKFTPVMEEVLLSLLVLFILSGEITRTQIVKKLCQLLGRSPNAVGSSLKALAELGLLTYGRQGRGMAATLSLENEFVLSLIIRFFGFRQEWLEFEDVDDFLTNPIGFIPITSNYPEFIHLLEQKTTLLRSRLQEYQEWLNWLDKLKKLESFTDKNSKRTTLTGESKTDPFHQLSQKIVSKIALIESRQVTPITKEQLTTLLTDLLKQEQDFPPWINSTYLEQQKSPFLIEPED